MSDTKDKFYVGGEIEEAPAGEESQGQEEGLPHEEEENERTDEPTALTEGNRGEQSHPRGIPISSSFPRFSSERTPLLRPSPSFVG